MNTFSIPTEIVYGVGCLQEIGEKVAAFGKNAMLVCDPFFAANGLAKKLQAILAAADVAAVIYDGVVPNPTTDSIDAGVNIARQNNCDVIIGLGGGSSMDTAKAISVGTTHDGPIWDYAIGNKDITAKALPIVAITTTSGTGSQCTCFSVITNPLTKQKPGMGSPFILPKLAVVDPDLIKSAPARLTFETGFDVFCHAVEAYTSTIASPISDVFAEKALNLVSEFLPRAFNDGSDMDARYNMALADTYAGIAINHGCVSVGHVIAHVISGHLHHIAHGSALYSVYKGVLKFNSQALPEKHKFIANCLDKGNDDICSAFDKFFSQFNFTTELPAALNAKAGLSQTLANDTFTYMKGIADLNPIEACAGDVEKILAEAI